MDGLLCIWQPVTQTLKWWRFVSHALCCLPRRQTASVDCQILLKHGADVDDETTYEQTPLHLAASGGNLEVVKVYF